MNGPSMDQESFDCVSWNSATQKPHISSSGYSQGKKTPWNKPPSLTKSMNIDIWDVGTSNQHFIWGS